MTAISRVVFLDWIDVPLAGMRTEHSGSQATVVNDEQAAAWGERLRGGDGDEDTMACITIPTGAGGGFVQAGSVMRDAWVLRTGHNPRALDDGSERSVVHVRASRLPGTARIGDGDRDAAPRLAAQPRTTEDAFRLADDGDRSTCGILRESARILAKGIANLRMRFDPAVVVLRGGVGLPQGYLELVQHEVSRRWPTIC